MRNFALILVLLLAAGCAVQHPRLTPAQTVELKALLGTGKVVPKCDSNCYGDFLYNISSLQGMYLRGDWPTLAASVVTIGHANELSYYYLGQAAEHAGYPNAAIVYYDHSVAYQHGGDATRRCGPLMSCPLAAGQQAGQRILALKTMDPNSVSGADWDAAASRMASGSAPGAVVQGAVTVNELRNCTFHDDTYEVAIDLKDGTWLGDEHPKTAKGNSMLSWRVTGTAIGDLNGDGIPDGAFVGATSVGTMASREIYLYVMLGGGRHTLLKAMRLGGRDFSLISVAIRDGEVLVSAKVARGDQDEREEPAGHADLAFAVQGGRLKFVPGQVQEPLRPPVAASASGEDAALRKAALNFSIKLGGRSVRFRDGRRSERLANQSSGKSYLSHETITTIATGDLNHDGHKDAAIVDVITAQGQPDDTRLIAVLFRKGRAVSVVAGDTLGVNTRVTALSVRGGVIHVTKLVPVNKIAGAQRVTVQQRFRIRQGMLEDMDAN